MRRAAWILAAFLLLAGCGQTEKPPGEDAAGAAQEEIISGTRTAEGEGDFSIQPAVLEGEGLSPDGRFQARVEGVNEGITAMGLYPSESIQITDAQTGEVLWEGDGFYEQSILWSPEGGFAALARSARTWCSVTVIETENWSEWEFTLPDGSSIPEYTFLPDDVPWGEWVSEGSLELTIGRGGDAGSQSVYQCGVWVTDDGVTGESREQTTEVLGSFDFTHDGQPETVERVTLWFPGTTDMEYCELHVLDGEGRVLWEALTGVYHVEETSLYALRLDGQDYLLQYDPFMGQGYCSYQYQIFSLDGGGEPVIYKEDRVEFDVNFGSPDHESYNIPAIAAFLQEVHGYLDGARELVNTLYGEIELGDVDYSDTAALEKALEDYQKEAQIE